MPDASFWPDNYKYDAWCVSPQFSDHGVKGKLYLNFTDQNLKEADYLLRLYSSYPRNNNQNAALQIAVWEAAIDGTVDFTAGNFRYGANGNTYLSQAQTYISALSNVSDWTNYTPWTGYVTDESDPNATKYQDFLVRPVPEPGTLLLLGSSLLGFGVIARYRRNKKA